MAVVDARGHAETVKLDLVKPFRPGGAVSTSWVSCGGIRCGRGNLDGMSEGSDRCALKSIRKYDLASVFLLTFSASRSLFRGICWI
jgi:hypothetical protein